MMDAPKYSNRWQSPCGYAVLYCANCRDILPHLAPLDIVLSDPPYSTLTHGKEWRSATMAASGAKVVASAHAGLGFEAIAPRDAAFVMREFARLARRWVGVFSDIEGLPAWREAAPAELEYIRSCVWDKVDSTPSLSGDRPASAAELLILFHPTGKKQWNGGGGRNVYRYAVNAEKGPKPHPTTKPYALMAELVRLYSNPGETILDPFMGSGSTGVAAIKMGRKFIGIEADAAHFATARKRISEALDQMAMFAPITENAP